MNTHGQSWSGGGARRWSVVLAWVLAVAAVAAFVAVLLSGRSTTVVRTVIERVPTTPGDVTQHTSAGALADAEALWRASDNASGTDQWTLAYRVDAYSPSTATLESWTLVTGGGSVSWETSRVTVAYANGRWQPAKPGDIEVLGAPAVDPSSSQFNGTIASFHRFPGAP